MSIGFFISGTDTNVGKTIVASILIKKLGYFYWKPIQCGFSENQETDTDIVQRLSGSKKIVKETIVLKNPLSPNIASRIEKKKICLSDFSKSFSLQKELIIEGAGGLNVPINDKDMVIDMIKFFSLPLILVCKTSLGTINHTLLSIEALKKKKIHLYGLIFIGNNIPETIETISEFGSKIYGKTINIIAILPIFNHVDNSSIMEMVKIVKI